jgi:site-specific recombinase XerD
MNAKTRVNRQHSCVDSVSLASAIEAHEWALKLERKSPHTINGRIGTLGRLLAYCEMQGFPADSLDAITPAHVKLWFASLRVEESTQQTYYRQLHAFWVWAINQEKIATVNPLDAIKPPRPDEKTIDGLSAEEVRCLVDICRNGASMHWRRDLAIVLLIVDTGLRVSELCSLMLDGWQQDRIHVMGKGRKERIVPLSSMTAKALWDYIHKERARVKLPEIWLNQYNRPLTRDGVWRILDRRAKEAGLRHIHPHMLRHTFALEWHRSGGPLSALQTLLGHSKPTMSLRYGRMSGEDCTELHRSHSPVDRLGLRITEKRPPKRPR